MNTAGFEQLRRIRLFAALEDEDLAAVGQLIDREHCPAGSVICRQGEPGVAWYYVESGELRAWHVDVEGNERVLAYLEPGSFFGEAALLLGEPCAATVEAVQDTTLWVLRKNDFDRLLNAKPALLDRLRITPEIRQRRRAKRPKWLDPDEAMVVQLRKHPVRLGIRLIIPSALLLLIVISTAILAGRFRPVSWLGGMLSALMMLMILYRVLDHFNDTYILTTKRVVHDERHLLLRDVRVEAPLRAIQNIQLTREGTLARVFDIGDLMIETAGKSGQVVFRHIRRPLELQDLILREVARTRAASRAQERAAIRSTIKSHFGAGYIPKTAAATPATSPTPARQDPLAELWEGLRGIARYFLPPLRDEQGDIVTWRKHWIALIGPISAPTLTAVLLSALAVLALYMPFGREHPLLVATVYALSLMTTLWWWLWRFEDWKNDLYQVTATRIVDIECSPFRLRESRREASLGTIQNVNLEVPGLLGKLLNYGSVKIETAGAGPFTFDLVKDPRGVQQEIFRHMEAFQEHQRQEEAEHRRREMLEWLTAYDQLRRSGSLGGSPSHPDTELP